MKFSKTIVLFLCAALFMGILVGCGEEPHEEYRPSTSPTEAAQFESPLAMQAVADGVWQNCQSGDYVYIAEGKLYEFGEMAKSEGIATVQSKCGDKFYTLSYDEFFDNYLTYNGIDVEYDHTTGDVIQVTDEQTYFNVSDSETARKGSILFSKGYYSETDINDILFNDFIETKYPDILSCKDVQFDRHGTLGKAFMIEGIAELDDYYNWGYDDAERNYFCIQITPSGGNYSDMWYIYASRSRFSDLYETLKDGSKRVTLVARTEYADTGSNNMATLSEQIA